MTYTVFLDLDGVIVDFDSRVSELVGKSDWSREEIVQAMKTPNFFLNLNPLPGAISQVHSLMRMIPGQVRILSATPHNHPELVDSCREQKLQWLERYLPDLVESALIVSNKGEVGTSADILIDDHPDWNGAENFPGEVVHYQGPEAWGTLRDIISARLDGASDSVKMARLVLRIAPDYL